MKTARRMLALLLALLMVFALVACGGSEDATPDAGNGGVSGNGGGDNGGNNGGNNGGGNGGGGNGGGEEENVWEQAPATMEDFVDKTYIIIQHSPQEDPFGYSQDSLLGASVADRVLEVQNKYSCTLEFTQIPYDDGFASKIQGLLYAENSGDMVFSLNNAKLRQTLGTGGEESAMQDLLALDNIINFWNFEKWGNITSRETMMAGGTFYGVSPALWVDCTPLPYYQVVYNKDLVETFGITDPQEFWEKGEWDRDNMLDLITSCYDDSGSVVIFGMAAQQNHMIRATALTAGVSLVEIDNIAADGSVEWHLGLTNDDVVEALTWLKNSLKVNGKYFNNGSSTWSDSGDWLCHEPLIEGRCVFAMTRPSTLFGSVVTSVDRFGLITWAGADANTLTGYYENCYSVAIPIFAQSAYQSAYLMYDLFEGMDGIETYEDVIAYYRETYFDSDIDVECLVREGATLQYSYWPNGVDMMWVNLTSGFDSASSMKALIEKNEHCVDAAIEANMVPNAVKLEQYRQNGFFK